MKYLAVLLLLGSCAHTRYPLYREPIKPKQLTHTERMEKCLYRLVEQSGVDPEKAQKACEGTFRRK